jgi:hypothetical protein
MDSFDIPKALLVHPSSLSRRKMDLYDWSWTIEV